MAGVVASQHKIDMYNSIKLKNIKGVTAEYKLYPVTIITGENGSGKSAILDGIISSLLGYHPRLGKKHSELSRLCSALPACVDFGPNGWTADAKGKVDVIPSKTPAFMLDLADFFGKTARERTQIVLDASGACGDVTGVFELLPTVAVQAIQHINTTNASEWFNSAIETLSKLSREVAADAKRSAEYITQERKSLPPQVQINPDELSELTNQQSIAMKALAKAESDLRFDWETKLRELQLIQNKTEDDHLALINEHEKAEDELKKLTTAPRQRNCPKCGKAMGEAVNESVNEAAIKTIKDRVKSLKPQIDSSAKVWRQAQANTINHNENKPSITMEIVSLKTKAMAIEANIREAQQRSQSAAVRQSKIDAIRKLEDESASKTMQSTHLSAALKEVKEEAEKFLAGAVGPVLRAANQLVETVFDFQIDFVDGEFGYRKGDVFVSKTLSGAEQLAVYAGLQLALCGSHSPKILIVDELGRLSPGRKVKFMRQVKRLVADGVINQFIGCDVSDSTSVDVKEA